MVKFADWAARWRVPLHFLLAVVVVVFARPTPTSLGVGGFFVAAGLAVRAWAAGHLRRERPLTTSGPYAHVRHPLYLGSSLLVAGFALAAGRLWLAALAAAYVAAFFPLVMRREEAERRARAPELYAAYAAVVPMFLPSARPANLGENPRARFDRGLYRRNGEWRALVGCAWLWLSLLGKLWWA